MINHRKVFKKIMFQVISKNKFLNRNRVLAQFKNQEKAIDFLQKYAKVLRKKNQVQINSDKQIKVIYNLNSIDTISIVKQK